MKIYKLILEPDHKAKMKYYYRCSSKTLEITTRGVRRSVSHDRAAILNVKIILSSWSDPKKITSRGRSVWSFFLLEKMVIYMPVHHSHKNGHSGGRVVSRADSEFTGS